jgi:hypothetical protein
MAYYRFLPDWRISAFIGASNYLTNARINHRTRPR